MKNKLPQYLHFTRAERNGALALCLLIIGSCAYTYWLRQRTPLLNPIPKSVLQAFDQKEETPIQQKTKLAFFDPNTASEEAFVQLGIAPKTAKTICKYREKGGRFFKKEDLQKIYSLNEEDYQRLEPYIRIGKAKNKRFAQYKPEPVERFDFDPNTATVSEFERLGLRSYIAERIIRYREKGGRFRKPEDFQKIYGITEEQFLALAPFIQIQKEESTDVAYQPTSYSGAKYERSYTPKEIPVIDINLAGSGEWDALPGIGAKRAAGIIKFRGTLGGFRSVQQVAECWALPDSVFQKIKPYLRLGTTSTRCLNINTVTREELSNHPYINWKQARLITAYREQHGPFSSLKDLQKIVPLRDDAWLQKIAPYLCTE